MSYNYRVESLKRLPVLCLYALLAYMPFHIFISTWAGTSLGGLDAWKVGKDVFLIGIFLLTALLVLVYVPYKKWQKYGLLIGLAAAYALLHLLVYVFNKDTSLSVAALASTYNNRFIWILLIGIGIGLLMKNPPEQMRVVKFVLGISTVVCLLGLAQWFLPNDTLVHFGYDPSLGVKPNFFINEDPAYPRVFATFRDPNSFGAYLIIPILLLVQLLQKNKRKAEMSLLLVLHLGVLYLSFSRAAWLGLAIGIVTLFFISHREKTISLVRRYWPIVLVGIVLLGAGLYSVRSTPTFRSIVLKADDKNAPTEMDSDEYHLHFIQEGLQDATERPLGYGPGTAGIVSIQNGENGRLTENYYIQIALEVGVIGLAMFVAIWVVAVKLLAEQEHTVLVVSLLASAASYAVMAMVMHLWTNEAVAIGWWGLAGLVLYRNSYNKKASP